MPESTHHQVIVVGGGTAGLTVAAQLCRQPNAPEVAIIEPSRNHYYQPLWTLVGAGVFDKEASERNEADFIPRNATWIQDAVTSFDPGSNQITTEAGNRYTYDYLVVAPGIQIDWDAIPGLAESVGQPGTGVVSNYSYEGAPMTWETMQQLAPGDRALFTQPSTPIKCGGAPQKIMYLTADHLRKRGILEQVSVDFFSPGTVVFGVEEFERTLKKIIDRYGIDFHFRHELTELRPDTHEAVFTITDEEGGTAEKILPYDMIHVTPPQSAPDVIKNSRLANKDGWVDVHKHTLQHQDYPNVFSLGDAAGTPNAKTGAAVRKQAPVVVENLTQLIRDGEITDPAQYDGYSSCPLVTGYGKLVLAEFDYDNNPAPSLPIDTTKERYSMYLLKAYLLPLMYWHGMLRGRA